MRSSRALKKKKKKYLRELRNSDEEFERELQETSSDEEDAAEEKRRLLSVKSAHTERASRLHHHSRAIRKRSKFKLEKMAIVL